MPFTCIVDTYLATDRNALITFPIVLSRSKIVQCLCLTANSSFPTVGRPTTTSNPQLNLIAFKVVVAHIADGCKGISFVVGEVICVVPQRAGELFGLFARRAGLRVIRRSDLATKDTEQRPESRNASDYYTKIDLDYGPFNDGLGDGVVDKACNRLDSEALHNGHEATKSVKEGQGDLVLVSADCYGHQGNNETDFTAFVKFQATEYREWHRHNEKVPNTNGYGLLGAMRSVAFLADRNTCAESRRATEQKPLV